MNKKISPNSQDYLAKRRVDLWQLLKDHLTIDNVKIEIDAQGCLKISTPEITQSKGIFCFENNEDFRKIFDICLDLGELKIAMNVPSVASGVEYTIFEIIELVTNIPEDEDFYKFIEGLGSYVNVKSRILA